MAPNFTCLSRVLTSIRKAGPVPDDKGEDPGSCLEQVRMRDCATTSEAGTR